MAIDLDKKAVSSARLIEDTTFYLRAKKLESIGEFGFAIIFYWNQIEASLKLIRYGGSIKEGWPDRLDRRWRTLQRLKSDHPEKYDLVLGSSSGSLWKARNEIAHEGLNVSVDSYRKYVEAALWLLEELRPTIPSLEQLKETKHRSDSQLARIKNSAACASNNKGGKYGKKG